MPYVSHNADERKFPVDMVVIHYTGMPSAKDALERLCDDKAKVGAHYLIDTDGTIYPLIDEKKRAWHAGVSFWAGRTDINSCSVGIELVNKGHEFGYEPFPDAQITSLTALAADIVKRYGISPCRVLGHSDVAPTRKADPGELFPWKTLAAKGVGVWTDGFSPLKESRAAALGRIGYDATDESAAMTAFCRHFYPQAVVETVGADKIDGRLSAVADVFDRLTRR